MSARIMALVLAAPLAAAQSITTTFVHNGGISAPNSGNMFDATVTAAGGLTITAIDVHTQRPPGQAVPVEVWVTPGTYVGVEDTQSAWTLVASGQGTSAGTGQPTAIDVTDFHLSPGSHGVYVVQVLGSILYTNGNGSNQQYVNADLQLDLGNSKNAKFRGATFVPRVWNGALHYTVAGSLVPYCTSKVNSLGCTPVIAASGAASVAASSGFTVSAAQVRNNKSGLLFYTVNGARAAAPFQCGALCLGPSGIRRTPARSAGGNPAPADDCSGLFAIDLNAFAAGLAGGNPDPGLQVAGSDVQLQWWGRDQGFAAPCNTTLSDAGEVVLLP